MKFTRRFICDSSASPHLHTFHAELHCSLDAVDTRRLTSKVYRYGSPSVDQALVDELELKLDQDERLIKEVRARFREESCEKQAYQMDYTSLKRVIQERVTLQHKMLMTRYTQHETLHRSNADNTHRMSKVPHENA